MSVNGNQSRRYENASDYVIILLNEVVFHWAIKSITQIIYIHV